jgi:tripartite-type tricarboxylate transporter receptor subunit TctC
MPLNPSRRQFLRLTACLATFSATFGLARAQVYPAHPIRIVIPYAPATSPDIIGRLLGQWLSEQWGTPVIIENRPGAGGTIGTEAVVRAIPDGHTLLYVVTSNTISGSLFEQLKFNFVRDIMPIAGITRVPNLVSTNPSIPVETLPQLIRYAKAHAGELNFSAPTGGTTLLSAELFKLMTGVDIVHVPYRGGPASISDLLSGRVQISFDAMPTTIGHVKNGKLRGLAVTTATRSPALPLVPTVGEFVAGYEASSWHGLGSPQGTPAEIVTKLNEAINAFLADPKIRARIAELGGVPMPMTPTAFSELIVTETEKWAEVIRRTGIKAQ